MRGFYVENAGTSCEFRDLTIEDCRAHTLSFSGSRGGGVYVGQGCTVVLTRVTIRRCGVGDGGWGGGLWLGPGAYLTATRVRLWGNWIGDGSGGGEQGCGCRTNLLKQSGGGGWGGGMWIDNGASAYFFESRFGRNAGADYGGGIAVGPGGTFDGLFSHFEGNHAHLGGGGLWVGAGATYVRMIRGSFWHNRACQECACGCRRGGGLHLENQVLFV